MNSNERIRVTRKATYIQHDELEDMTKGEMVATLFHRLNVQELATVYANAQSVHPILKSRIVFLGPKKGVTP
jgi:hypothetical protein